MADGVRTQMQNDSDALDRRIAAAQEKAFEALAKAAHELGKDLDFHNASQFTAEEKEIAKQAIRIAAQQVHAEDLAHKGNKYFTVGSTVEVINEASVLKKVKDAVYSPQEKRDDQREEITEEIGKIKQAVKDGEMSAVQAERLIKEQSEKLQALDEADKKEKEARDRIMTGANPAHTQSPTPAEPQPPQEGMITTAKPAPAPQKPVHKEPEPEPGVTQVPQEKKHHDVKAILTGKDANGHDVYEFTVDGVPVDGKINSDQLQDLGKQDLRLNFSQIIGQQTEEKRQVPVSTDDLRDAIDVAKQNQAKVQQQAPGQSQVPGVPNGWTFEQAMAYLHEKERIDDKRFNQEKQLLAELNTMVTQWHKEDMQFLDRLDKSEDKHYQQEEIGIANRVDDVNRNAGVGREEPTLERVDSDFQRDLGAAPRSGAKFQVADAGPNGMLPDGKQIVGAGSPTIPGGRVA